MRYESDVPRRNPNAPKHSGGRLFSEKFFIHLIQTRAKETDNAARAKVRVFTPFFFGLGSFGQDLCFVEITEADRYYLTMTYKEEFITFMVRSGVLTFGDFTTKSGRRTPYFVNTGNYKRRCRR